MFTQREQGLRPHNKRQLLVTPSSLGVGVRKPVTPISQEQKERDDREYQEFILELQNNEPSVNLKNNYRLSLAAGLCFYSVFTWALANTVEPHLTASMSFNALGIVLASITAIICFSLMILLATQLKKAWKDQSKIERASSLLNIGGLYFGICGSIIFSLSLSGMNLPAYIAPAFFIAATLSMAIGHVLNINKQKKEKHSGSKYHWLIDTLSILMQTIGAIALCNLGLKEAGLDHFNINKLGIIIMLSIALVGALGMMMKNDYNARNNQVEYLPPLLSSAKS